MRNSKYWRSMLGLLGGFGFFAFVFRWIFTEYVPSKAVDTAFGWTTPIIAHWLGMTDAQLTSALQGAVLPTLAAALAVWLIFKAALHFHQARAILALPVSGVADNYDVPKLAIGEWKLAAEAVESFAEYALIEARDKWQTKFEDSYIAGEEAKSKLRKIESEGTADPHNDARAQQQRARLRVHTLGRQLAQDELRRVWQAIRDDIEAKLRSGKLVARGFRAPHVPGNDDVDISATEWRILSLDNTKSEATRKDGNSAAYVGIAIKQSDTAETEAPIWRAIAHVRPRIGDHDSEHCYPITLKTVRQAALDGKLAVRGRKEIDRGNHYKTEFSDVYSDIPAEYWEMSKINALATSENYPDAGHTDPETAYSWGPKGLEEKKRYAGLRIDMHEVMRLWP